MRYLVAMGFALLAGSAAISSASAAEQGSSSDRARWESQYRTRERTYYREHRLRSYQQSRAGMRQGSNCVTPKGVCWIAEPLSRGRSCTCETRRFGQVEGVIGG
ncbi:hypothetical protein [Microvirga thermotolerans]|uniref:Uncharacterized protein n=1 Tax=Microvirga thermotolerans TaxID=2651334 RepID=A0A5P9K062_9HYPH|nr:hypothetical protein [Microvirga thermotolerans]QFU15594.1 hypothetical protein GDR74_04850 [Microvirga thermotolerans]